MSLRKLVAAIGIAGAIAEFPLPSYKTKAHNPAKLAAAEAKRERKQLKRKPK